jgi:hypothetical protein
MHCKGNDEKGLNGCGYLGNYTITYKGVLVSP